MMIKTSTPTKDGFFMPAEFAAKSTIFLAWPQRADNWRNNGAFAQQQFAYFAQQLRKEVKVIMYVSQEQYDHARSMLGDDIELMVMEYNDAWMRDIGPTAVTNKARDVRLISWIFNAWGGDVDGLYSPWDKDDLVAEKTANILGLDYYRAPFVLEGGAILSDGEGTLYTTEECLLSAGRNPHLSKDEIATLLCDYLGVEKIIWLKNGLYNDETNGHVDNIIKVVAPAEVMLSWCDDPNDPQYAISRSAYDVLSTQKDARGRSINVHKLPMAGPLYSTEEEASSVEPSSGMKRHAGERLSASYANSIIVNNTIFIPQLDAKADHLAQQAFQHVLPNHKSVLIPAREILLGGGNLHCITQAIPEII